VVDELHDVVAQSVSDESSRAVGVVLIEPAKFKPLIVTVTPELPAALDRDPSETTGVS
jgi:hypothetical protein